LNGFTIPVDQDFVVGWTGGSGLVQVTLDNAITRKTAVCRFPASAGSGVVPKAVLELLGRGFDVQLAIDTVDVVRLELGDWSIDVSATFNGMWSNDQIAFADVELQ
jgi:hypothetical protein